MSTDGLHHTQLNSAFCQFVPNATSSVGHAMTHTSNVCDMILHGSVLNCVHVPDGSSPPQLWYAPNSISGSNPKPLSFGASPSSNSSALDGQVVCDFTGIADNVGKCVTVVDEETVGTAQDPSLPSEGFLSSSYAEYINTSPYVLKKFWNAENSKATAYVTQTSFGPMQPPTMPLIVPSSQVTSENIARRQAYYHQRHHPHASPNGSHLPGITNELKNKNRFSATGACGDSTVVRDSKMSLSSAPPSPNAGTLGGSLGSSYSRSYFNQLPQSQMVPLAITISNSNGYQRYITSPKKVSDMSTSSTLSSYSSSSLSSTHSLPSVSPRKRRADEEESYYHVGMHTKCNGDSSICHTCSTSDVTAGVNHVHLYDRTSTGSCSPVEQMMRRQDTSRDHNPQKRSKNDNDEDDDVVFVSMEGPSTVSKQKSGLSVASNAEVPYPFVTIPTQRHSSKSKRKSKKFPSKKNKRPVGDSKTSASPVSFAIPITAAYPAVVSNHQPAQPSPGFLVPSSSSANRSPCYETPVVPMTEQSGYFLRSSVNGRVVKKTTMSEKNYSQQGGRLTKKEQAVLASDKPVARYHTRSQQKRKDVVSQQAHFPVPQPSTSSVGEQMFQPITQNIEQTNASQSNNLKRAEDPVALTESVLPPTPNIADQRSSSSFKKIYDLKGLIGVGGGGSVYAGTRKSDNAQVAIKQVPKAKVKRWGKLDGRVVPIEFELLHKASYSGNKGVIKMLDWYERRNSYILVMERPQPVIDLFDYLNQHGALAENVAKNIFTQLVHAVRHCHTNGVIHRDIKDENVLLNLHTSEAKLIDFGCGTMLKNVPYTEFAGTPEFYPPEWFIERRYEGKRVDAWSLGVLLYTMVEAEVPFQKEKDIVACELTHKRAQNTTSSACRHLIASMLQKDQRKRPTLEEVLRHPWMTNDHTLPAQALAPTPSKIRSVNSSEVLDTSDVYIDEANSSPVPPSPASPPISEQKQNKMMGHFQSERYLDFSSPSYSARVIGHRGVGPGSPVPIGIQSNECIVIS
ncbi:uncharacterized protein LOC143444389 [Clavelina lepadiformis]|uniref:uncharacterized protein LOC143444389 n=1 Tax=Clavelina lepadiformis TaxID=159417 RepID=UPI0040414615